MKSCLSAFARAGVLLLGLVPGLAWSYTVSLTGPDTVVPGDRVAFALDLTGADTYSLGLEVAYDPAALGFVEFRLDSGLAGGAAFASDAGGNVTVSIAPLDPLPSGGTYGELDFDVLGPLGLTTLTPTVDELTSWSGAPAGFPSVVSAEDIMAIGASTTVVPIAPAWLLALSGFGVLAWLQRARRRAA